MLIDLHSYFYNCGQSLFYKIFWEHIILLNDSTNDRRNISPCRRSPAWSSTATRLWQSSHHSEAFIFSRSRSSSAATSRWKRGKHTLPKVGTFKVYKVKYDAIPEDSVRRRSMSSNGAKTDWLIDSNKTANKSALHKSPNKTASQSAVYKSLVLYLPTWASI